MAYNFSLKKYANGTFQLTYYDYPVLDSFDKEIMNYIPYDRSESFLYDDSENYTPFGYIDGEIEPIEAPVPLSDANDNEIMSPEELEKKS